MTSPSLPFYVGTFRHNLDGKNRLTIPSKWRFAGDEADVYLAFPHPGGFVQVLPPGEKDRLYNLVTQISFSDVESQKALQRMFANAEAFGCDKQGRVTLTAGLASFAGIAKEAVLVGSLTKFAIWSPQRWEETEGDISGAAYDEGMRRLGL